MDLRWVEVNLKAIKHNILEFKKLLNGTYLGIVVKSNAYGHGLIEVSKAGYEVGVDYLFVVSIEEALKLVNSNIQLPIIVIGYVPEDCIIDAAVNNVEVALYSLNQAIRYKEKLEEKNLKLKVHIKVDTGIGRLGILPNEALEFVKNIINLNCFIINGIYTHFADAETPENSYTKKQIKLFKSVLAKLENNGIDIPIKHMAGSAATLMAPESRFNLVRLGIAIYGLWPSKETEIAAKYKSKLRKIKLIPAMSYKTRIVQIKTLPLGYSVGYGCTFKTPRPTKIGVLPVGYAEGYDRHLSNIGRVLVNGQFAPIVGRVCMNMSMVDLTDIKDVKEYDEVVLFGEQREERLPVEELADKIGTINYEVTTRIPEHIKRVYIY